MIAPTHFFFALALAYILRLPRIPTVLGGVLVDLDVVFSVLSVGFPLEHRGIVHTPLFLAACVALLHFSPRPVKRPVILGFASGFLSHLLLDMATPYGVMLLFPLPVFFTLNLAVYSNAFANLGLVLASTLAIIICSSQSFQKRMAFGPLVRLAADMGEQRFRLLMLALFIAISLAIAGLAGHLSGYFVPDPFGSFYPPEGMP
jgi:membrane-bound metal-dependent hydrolase YbcI (DUF457 family)